MKEAAKTPDTEVKLMATDHDTSRDPSPKEMSSNLAFRKRREYSKRLRNPGARPMRQ